MNWNLFRKWREARADKERRVLNVLYSPRTQAAHCSPLTGRSRGRSRLWLDDESLAGENTISWAAVRACRRLARRGLITMEFRNPFFIGHGTHFVALTESGLKHCRECFGEPDWTVELGTASPDTVPS